MTQSSPISRIWWLYLPVLFMVFQIILEITVPHSIKARLHSESGPHEFIQSILITAAFIIAGFGVIKIDWKAQKYLGLWLALASLCCFYVSGEEISWGQHVLNWNTPSYWAQFNDQNETNLHNTSDWLDQKPRLLLFLGIAVGGLIIPALRRWKPSALPERFSIIYPPDYLVVIALGVTVPYLAQEFAEIFNGRLFERVSEVQELYMYYFVMLYLLYLVKFRIIKK